MSGSVPKIRIPKYCHHKGKGLAYVTLNGEVKYLGQYGTLESKAAYDQLIAAGWAMAA